MFHRAQTPIGQQPGAPTCLFVEHKRRSPMRLRQETSTSSEHALLSILGALPVESQQYVFSQIYLFYVIAMRG